MPAEFVIPPGSEILVLEDDLALRKRIAAHLRQLGAEVAEASRLEEARRLLRDLSFDFAVVDLHLPDGEVLELLRENAFSENTGIVVMTAFGGVKQAVEAMRRGASDYLSKPFELEQLDLALAQSRQSRRAARREEQRAERRAAETSALFFGRSLEKIQQQLSTLAEAENRLQRRLPPVLIEGETGTGKSVLARWIHERGARPDQPFVSLNCAALPEALAEAELFGHERGAFTDAKRARMGLFEAADGGTLFLDEISSLGLATQAKLLGAIEENKIRRLGATREISLDVRLIAASNQPLAQRVQAGAFREDLFHRLNLLHLVLPPLRERGGDIVMLARHLLSRLSPRYDRKNATISPQGEARLTAQPWPGNIRELAHEIERALIFSSGETLDFSHLGPASTPLIAPTGWRNPAWRLPESGFSLDQVVNDLVAEALRETDNNVSAAARRLGVTRDFLRYRLPGESAEEKRVD